jgi:murein DD-endopeptidase MepM/ murein hydrolase activator NlpD
MSTIKGIFEPFYPYVTGQLKLRKEILGNIERETIIAGTLPGQQDDIEFAYPQIKASAERHQLFHKYLTERQCMVRMASGVDIRKENNILEPQETAFVGENLAKLWVLEGGIMSNGTHRFGIYEGGISDSFKAYGDPTLRSDAKEGYGIVPMPGILDATIDTKSEDGSLREATVNWVCHNRRQLEVLEALYMRPGYPILLEWGWTPFIDNEGYTNNEGYPILDKFFEDSTFEEINLKIRERKIESSGNYDGFVGYCKNFMFKQRDDGGFICTTEIIAQGEILESLKSKIKLVPKMVGLTNYEFVNFLDMFYAKKKDDDHNDEEKKRIRGVEIAKMLDGEVEPIDNFLYYLRSIKHNLDKAGDKAALTMVGTQYQKWFGGKFGYTPGGFQTLENLPNEKYHIIGNKGKYDWYFPTKFQPDEDSELAQMVMGYHDDDNPNQDAEALMWKKVQNPSEYGLSNNDVEFSSNTFYFFVDDEGNYVPVAKLNELDTSEGGYVDGFKRIEVLIKELSKTTQKSIDEQKKNWENIVAGLKNQGAFFRKHEQVAPGGSAAVYNGKHKTTDDYDEWDGEWDNLTIRAIEGIGIEAMLDGTIIKEFSVEDESATDSGIRKKIYVRWDLICEILNRLTTTKYKKEHAVVELTYLTKNTPTYRVGGVGGGKKFDKDQYGNKVNGYYIPYAPPKESTLFPFDLHGLSQQYDDLHKGGATFQEWDKGKNYPIPPANGLSKEKFIKNELMSQGLDGYGGELNYEAGSIKYPPILGRSFDNNICLMPHQIPSMTPEKQYTTGNAWDTNPDEKVKKEQEEIKNGKNITSFKNVKSDLHSIGHVMFNLDYLISTYEELTLESYQTTNSLGEEMTQRRLKKKFSFHDWITKIWNGVNDACAGYYDFGLHVEHERPNVARVIDFTMSGGTKDAAAEIFEFNPQGLNSISRDFHFQSKLDNDFASTISIAAQAPNELQSLEAVSFKAFHKGIKNRFTEGDKDYRDYANEAAANMYKKDYQTYRNTLKSLLHFIKRQNNSNYESDLLDDDWSGDEFVKKVISAETAKSMARGLDELRTSLEHREPEYLANGEKNPKVGQWKEGVSSPRNAIIPLTVNMTIDGIAGMHPLNIFKVNKEKLPKGYEDPNIVFVMKNETHKITAGQDWTVDITGYLSMLDDTPPTGTNDTIDFGDLLPDKANRIDASIPIGLINPTMDIRTGTDIGTNQTFSYIRPDGTTKTSPYAFLISGKDWPFRDGKSDFSHKDNSHLGLDIILPPGTPLYAMGDGTVTSGLSTNSDYKGTINSQGNPTGRGAGWGAWVQLKLSDSVSVLDGYASVKKILYGHCSKIVKQSGTVKKGDLIALSGGLFGENGSGNSQAPHLHIECGPSKYRTSGFMTPLPGTYGGEVVRHKVHHNRLVNGFVLNPLLILNYEGKYPFGVRVDEYEEVT